MKCCVCSHDEQSHAIGTTVWGELLWQCDDCDPGEVGGGKWHKFAAAAVPAGTVDGEAQS